METIFILLVSIISFTIGFLNREILSGLRAISNKLDKLGETRKNEDVVSSRMVEPESAAEYARRQHEKMMRDLNQ